MHTRILLLSALLCAGCTQEWTKPHIAPQQSSRVISVDDLNKNVSIIGRLGKPLGTILTIQGRPVQPGERNDYRSNNIAHNLFQVESVDGQPIPPMDIQIDLQPGEKFPASGQIGWIGYEDGGFEGIPPQANKMPISASQPHIQSRGRSFITRFHALQPAPHQQSPRNTSLPAGQFG
jgi:hypothetical protein